jgi:hypothetical protein
MLSEVDEAIFLEVKGKNRIVHYRNSRMAARTTLAELPDSVPQADFDLQKHLTLLQGKQSKADAWSL